MPQGAEGGAFRRVQLLETSDQIAKKRRKLFISCRLCKNAKKLLRTPHAGLQSWHSQHNINLDSLRMACPADLIHN